jgi:DNA mismatch repair ATPase MutS
MTDIKQHNSLESVNDVFKIPICYNKKVQKLNNTVIQDLELIQTKEPHEGSIYQHVFCPSNKPSLKIIEQFAHNYTTDIAYLKDTQNLVKSLNKEDINTIHNKYNFNDFDLDDTVSLWEEIKGETGFLEKYLYIDWEFAKHLNNNPLFLQLMNIYYIASPILSLCLPILVLIIPFFVIKLKGIELNIKEYIEILKVIISNHAMFKVFSQFNQVDTNQKIYLVISAAFYVFSIYQNVLVCIRFYSNMQKIHTYLFKFRQYLAYTLELINYHSSKTNELTNYTDFNKNMIYNTDILTKLYNRLNNITPFTVSFLKIKEIGDIMHIFYELYNNEIYTHAFLYSFGFHGYFTMMCHFNTNIVDNKISKTKFIKKGKPIFKKMYYPKFINEHSDEIVKNDCKLNKNMIITGPNASGKTTTLKTALINIILSQQFGYGCFDSLNLSPYDLFHCYLNIPDTSGRDSLFQAEAKRCKEIIDCVEEDHDKTHFCIFDELYSGTNPEEAVISGAAFMDYIVKNKNVTCLLTTHYVKLCKKLAKNPHLKNYNMKTIITNDNIKYTYLIQDGISKTKGGLIVLRDMNYPKKLLDITKS